MFILGLLIYSVRDLGLGPAAIGLVFTAGGVGSFIGAWFGARVTGRFGYGRVLLVTLIVGNAAPLGTSPSLGGVGARHWCCCARSSWSWASASGSPTSTPSALRQTAVPEYLRGRVNAAYRLISWGAIPLGAAAGGIVATQASAQVAMITGALGMSLATLWVAFSAVPRLRTISDAGSQRVATRAALRFTAVNCR